MRESMHVVWFYSSGPAVFSYSPSFIAQQLEAQFLGVFALVSSAVLTYACLNTGAESLGPFRFELGTDTFPPGKGNERLSGVSSADEMFEVFLA